MKNFMKTFLTLILFTATIQSANCAISYTFRKIQDAADFDYLEEIATELWYYHPAKSNELDALEILWERYWERLQKNKGFHYWLLSVNGKGRRIFKVQFSKKRNFAIVTNYLKREAYVPIRQEREFGAYLKECFPKVKEVYFD